MPGEKDWKGVAADDAVAPHYQQESTCLRGDMGEDPCIHQKLRFRRDNKFSYYREACVVIATEKEVDALQLSCRS